MRSRFHIAGILILFLLTVLIIFVNNRRESKEDIQFAVENIDEVRSVEIVSGDDILSLNYSPEGWLVNQKWKARESAIDFLLKTLQSLEVKSTVSDLIFNDEITDKNIEPIEVKIFGSRKLIRSFLIYQTDSIPGGNVMKRGRGTRPYIVYLPGYDFNPGNHFVADELFWKPFSVFDLAEDGIRAVKVSYGPKEIADIEIRLMNRGFRVTLNGIIPAAIDTNSVKRYLAYFSYVPFESWVTDMEESERSQVNSQVPEFIIEIGLTDGKSAVFKGWRKIIRGEGIGEYDTDRLYGSINDGKDIFIVRYFDIDPLLKSPDYFLEH